MSATMTEKKTGIPGTENMPLTTDSQSFVSRVYDLPLVKDSINQAYSIVQSNTYSAAAYEKASALSTSLLKATEPLQKGLEPQITTAEGYANAGLDYVEKKFPVVKSETGEIIGMARKPADQAVTIAKTYADGIQSRLSPVTEQFQFRIQQTSETLHGLQERLSSTLAKVPRDKASANESVVAIQKELESISHYFVTQSKNLPSNAHEALKPLIERFAEGYSHVKEELSKPDVPVSAKATNVLTYTKDQVGPILNESINIIKQILAKSKTEADAKVDDAKTKVNGITNGSS